MVSRTAPIETMTTDGARSSTVPTMSSGETPQVKVTLCSLCRSRSHREAVGGRMREQTSSASSRTWTCASLSVAAAEAASSPRTPPPMTTTVSSAVSPSSRSRRAVECSGVRT